MRVMIIEDNLIWSVRIRKSIEALGGVATVVDRIEAYKPEEASLKVDAVILNLQVRDSSLKTLALQIQQRGAFLIVHAGHKESELLMEGKNLGANYIATNSQLFHKIREILAKIPAE